MPLTQIVPEGQEIVIYRWGRFSRIDGPGLVLLTPGLDEIHEHVDVREQLLTPIVGVTTGGVPLKLKLHYTARLNIRHCGDKARQAEITSWDAWQREQKRDDSVNEVVLQAVKGYERTHPPAPGAGIFEKLIHVFAGSEANAEVLVTLRQLLAPALRHMGYELRGDAPLYLTIDGLPDKMGEALDGVRADTIAYEQRKRVWQDMLTYVNSLPPHLQVHMMAIAEQLQPPPINLAGAGSNTAQVNAQMGPDGQLKYEVEVHPPTAAPPPAQQPPVAAQQPPVAPRPPVAPPTAPDWPEPPLTADDVAQLKAPPPARGQAQQVS